MGYTALYRKFRPLTFGEMVGQEAITRTLKNQIIANRVGHAYLFNGGRGTGKTSAAKILARAVNCLNPKDGEPCNECEICKEALAGALTDIVEMDAASNNSVEDIRSIREEVNFLPTKAKYRVYIIDEVHMLSTGAFNALLKTLEEPPEHVKFILATTEPQKLPATILSRCQRFDFKRISNEDIIKRLKIVCEESKIEITEEALNIIAILSEGAMRDALSILERCVQDGDNKIDENKIRDLVGIPSTALVHDVIDSVFSYDIDKTLEAVDVILNEGKDIVNLLWEMIKYCKDVLVYKTAGKLEMYNDEEKAKIKNIADKTTKEQLINIIYELSEMENDIKRTTQKTIMFQAGMIKLCQPRTMSENNVQSNGIQNGQNSSSNLEARVAKIENYLRNNRNVGQVVHQGNMQEGNAVFQNGITNMNTTTNIAEKSVSNNLNNSGNSSNLNSAVKQTKTRSNSNNTTATTTKFSRNSEEYWPQILNDLKQRGKRVLYTNLMGTNAKEINDMTVGIEFPNGMTSFGKLVLDKQENMREISNLVSMACGKEMQIKYIVPEQNTHKVTREENLQNLANESDIPFNIID